MSCFVNFFPGVVVEFSLLGRKWSYFIMRIQNNFADRTKNYLVFHTFNFYEINSVHISLTEISPERLLEKPWETFS